MFYRICGTFRQIILPYLKFARLIYRAAIFAVEHTRSVIDSLRATSADQDK